MTALLEVRGIGKYFGNVIALKDVSTVVNSGQVTCVLGDNGALVETTLICTSSNAELNGLTIDSNEQVGGATESPGNAL